jgi:peptidoglycan/xylan/chitin deacetylase (PgdA/CDA1 family)
MCTEDEQTAQITRAHEWIKARFATEVSVFAYPNGNSTAHAENVLERLEYDAAVLFDHRVARVDHPLRVSRVRVNSTDTLAEFIAKVSGVHPFVHRMLARQ